MESETVQIPETDEIDQTFDDFFFELLAEQRY